MEKITTYYKGANKEKRALQTQKNSRIVRMYYCDDNYNILTERHQRNMAEEEDYISVHIQFREIEKWVQTKSTKIPKKDIVRKKQSRLELDQAVPKLDEPANVKQPTIATYGEIASIIRENEIREKVSKLPD